MTYHIKVIIRTQDVAWFSFTDIPQSVYYGVYNYKDHSITVVRRQSDCWVDYTVALITEYGIAYNNLPKSCKFIKACEKNYADINAFFLGNM